MRGPADIFRLPRAEAKIAKREGWGEVSARNLSRAIEARRRIALARFIYALGIRRIGEANARLLARHYGSFEQWRAQMLAAVAVGSEARGDLESISGIGPAIAEELVDFFAEPRNVATLDELAALLSIEAAERAESGGAGREGGGVHRQAGDDVAPGGEGTGGEAGCAGNRQRLEEDGFGGAGRRCRLQGAQGGGVGRADGERGGVAGDGGGVARSNH